MQETAVNKLVQEIKPGAPTIEVSQSLGFTVNLQGYESARLDATITIKGELENKEEIKALVAHELEEAMQKQIRDIVAQHDPNKTLLGHRK